MFVAPPPTEALPTEAHPSRRAAADEALQPRLGKTGPVVQNWTTQHADACCFSPSAPVRVISMAEVLGLAASVITVVDLFVVGVL